MISLQALHFHNVFIDDLPVQLGIRGKGDVLVLDRGVHLHIPITGIISINTDAFPENKLNTRLADPMGEMDSSEVSQRKRYDHAS